LQLLERESHRSLTLFAAPTGYGKSALMEDWARSMSPDIFTGWLTLEETDNDRMRMLGRLTAILPTEEGAESSPSLDSVVRSFYARREICLFLDQFEAIRETGIRQMITDLIIQAPTHVRFYIAGTDVTPLMKDARIPHSDLLVVTADYLKLDRNEMRQMVKLNTGIELENDAVQSLERLTEGWLPAVSSFISYLDGSRASPRQPGEAIDAVVPDMRRFFLHRVFSRQSSELQSFMLQTSIPDFLDKQLAFELTDHPKAADMIEQLAGSGLFLFQEASDRYRYPALYANFLRDHFKQTDQERYELLYDRHGVWLENRGLLLDAIRHWLHISSYERATRAFLADIPALFSHPTKLVLQVLDAFPLKELISRPTAAILYVWFLIVDQRISTAETVLHQTEAGMAEDQSYLFALTGEDLRGYIASFHSIIYYLRNDHEKGTAFMKETESRLNGRGLIYCHTSSISRPVSSLFKSAFGHWGSLDQSIAMCEYAEEKWRGDSVGYGYFQALLGECYYERNQLGEAETRLLIGRRIGLDRRDAGLLLPTTLTLVQMKLNEGNAQAARMLLEETQALLADQSEGTWLLDACKARLCIETNDAASISRWIVNREESAAGTHDHNYMYGYLTLLRALLYTEQFERGIAFAESLLQYSHSLYRHYYKAELHLLLALFGDGMGNNVSVVRHLEQALRIGHAEGYVQLFHNDWKRIGPLMEKYGKQLQLALLQDTGDTSVFYEQLRHTVGAAAPNLGGFDKASDLLTPTEYKVLQLLLEGRSNAFIAGSLNNSIETIKSHCKKIYKKLELKNRVEVRAHFERVAPM
jgi:LuxR family maltose regulon positive regulatory protein